MSKESYVDKSIENHDDLHPLPSKQDCEGGQKSIGFLISEGRLGGQIF